MFTVVCINFFGKKRALRGSEQFVIFNAAAYLQIRTGLRTKMIELVEYLWVYHPQR